MKLRIKGDSLRLRLSRTEVRDFATAGQIRSQTSFPAGRPFVYGLAHSESPRVEVRFDDSALLINVPKSIADVWASTDQVSIREQVPLANGSHLVILVEKDFKCLSARVGEDEGDLFENPLAPESI